MVRCLARAEFIDLVFEYFKYDVKVNAFNCCTQNQNRIFFILFSNYNLVFPLNRKTSGFFQKENSMLCFNQIIRNNIFVILLNTFGKITTYNVIYIYIRQCIDIRPTTDLQRGRGSARDHGAWPFSISRCIQLVSVLDYCLFWNFWNLS